MFKVFAFVVLSFVVVSNAASLVNSRLVPDTTDFSAQGSQSLKKAQFLLMRDLANILPSATGGDGINVDSIRSNPNVDSLAGDTKFSGRPTFSDLVTFSDSIGGTFTVSGRPTFTDLVTLSDSTAIGAAGAGNLKIGGGAEIDSITINDSTNDTLIIKIGGKVFKIDCDSDA